MSERNLIRCMCGCVMVEISKFTDLNNDPEYYLNAYESSFAARQRKLKQYLKRLWSAIIGKDFLLYELMMDQAGYDQLCKFQNKD